jgi:hypothetical protein
MRPRQYFYKTLTTLEAAGVLTTPLYSAGEPSAASLPSPGMAGAALTTYSGQLPFFNPPGGSKTYLSHFESAIDNQCTVYLCDRLWHNSGIVVTTVGAQVITSVTLPTRDVNGASKGEHCFIGLEVTAATTNAAANTGISLRYTNSTPAGPKTATMSSFPATAVAGTFVPFELAAGDTGVSAITDITLGTSLVTGSVSLVVYRILAMSSNTSSYSAIGNVDWPKTGLVNMQDNTVPFLLIRSSAVSVSQLQGSYRMSQG